MAIAKFTNGFDPADRLEGSEETYIAKRIEKEIDRYKDLPRTVTCPICEVTNVHAKRKTYPICGACYRKTPEGREEASLKLKARRARKEINTVILSNGIKVGAGKIST